MSAIPIGPEAISVPLNDSSGKAESCFLPTTNAAKIASIANSATIRIPRTFDDRSTLRKPKIPTIAIPTPVNTYQGILGPPAPITSCSMK